MVQHLHVLEINYCLYRLISTSSATRVYWFQSLTSALHNENSLKMHSVITSRKSKNDRQYNNQKKKTPKGLNNDLQHNTQKTKD